MERVLKIRPLSLRRAAYTDTPNDLASMMVTVAAAVALLSRAALERNLFRVITYFTRTHLYTYQCEYMDANENIERF